MQQIKVLQNKYRQASVECDAMQPYKYIPEIIKELSTDMNEIEKIISKHNDTEVLKLCDSLKSEINTRLKYFRNKLENIPNKNYKDESDEEWVDKNKPN